MTGCRKQDALGFTLAELVIVIVIIGVIAGIAVPRRSRGAAGAIDAALKAMLTTMRKAIDHYAAEHGGDFPTVATFVEQLTTFTDDAGDDSATKTVSHIFGPYLKAVPALSVFGEGSFGAPGHTDVAAADAADVGWIYDQVTGGLQPNTGVAVDESGTKYSDY